MKQFRDRVAVITGAASGIGRALAERFAEEGMRLVLADIDAAALSGVADALGASGATVLPVHTDVSKAADADHLADAAWSAFGAVHLLCNNAGIACEGVPAWEQTPETWTRVLAVNLWGAIHGVRAFVPRMIADGHEGHIVNTASAAGLRTGPFVSPYYASKHAVVAFTESLHFDLQLAGSKLKVSALCPAFVKTSIADHSPGFPPAMRARVEAGMEPRDIAQRVLEAVRDEKFWILTHPEFDELIRTRFLGMLQAENPVPHVFGATFPAQ